MTARPPLPIQPDLIEELRDLLKSATARPWAAFDDGGKILAVMKGPRPRSYSSAKERKWQEIISWTGFDSADVPWAYRRVNLHLIVGAVNSLPAILDHVATLQAQLDEIENQKLVLEQFAKAAQERIAKVEAQLERVKEALTDMRAAVKAARNMVPDEDEGLASQIFAYHLNAADMRACKALLSLGEE